MPPPATAAWRMSAPPSAYLYQPDWATNFQSSHEGSFFTTSPAASTPPAPPSQDSRSPPTPSVPSTLPAPTSPAQTPGPATTTGYFDLSVPRALSPLDQHVGAGANVWEDNASTSPAPALAYVPALEFDPLGCICLLCAGLWTKHNSWLVLRLIYQNVYHSSAHQAAQNSSLYRLHLRSTLPLLHPPNTHATSLFFQDPTPTS
ncbi:hypothetical protein EDD22DRAFT_960764 [Suillus occidentalis]|nr:hypothetical protein EDD22DRAFT_960764 [Suillus occidentalis]